MNSENKLRKIGIALVLLASLIGFGSSIYLTQHFYEVRGGTAGFKSLCNISATMNCDVVAASKYSEFVAGIPLSAFTCGWFLALFVVALMIAFSAAQEAMAREAKRAALVMSGIGLIFSVIYLVIMNVEIHTLCLFCLIVDGANVLAFAGSLMMKPEGTAQSAIDWSKWKTFAATIVGCLVVSIVLLKGFDESPKATAATEDEMTDSILNSPALAVGAGSEYPSVGNASAPITIVEFSDFQCPYCKMAAVSLNTVLNRYPNDVRVVFRNFPLNVECNPKGHNMHPYSCDAARVALCGQAQGKFKETYESLFENQEKLAPGVPAKLAAEAGVDPTQLANCVSKTDINMAIQKDVQEGIQLGVESTPTLFINGHKVEGAIPLNIWSKLIDRLLKK